MKYGALFLIILFVIEPLHAQTDSNVHYLPEFTFSIKLPIRISADTISYTVDSFSNNPNATTEEAIKRLPGVETEDGKIKIQGKEVKKVFVNGKEYNNSELSTLIQNLPAETLDKIEFADWVDEEAQFTGVVTGMDEKVMHLKLKPQYSRSITGQATAGAGTGKRFQNNLFSNYMGSRSRLTIIGNRSNTGSGTGYNSLSFSNSSPGITERKKLSANFASDLSPKLNITAAYDFTQTGNLLESESLRKNFLPSDSLLFSTNNTTQNNKNGNHRLHLKLLYKISENARLRSNLNISHNQSQTSATTEDASFTDENFQQAVFQRAMKRSDNNYAPSVNFSSVFQKRFSKAGRSFSLSANASYNQNNTSGLNAVYNIVPATEDFRQFMNTGEAFNGRAGFNLQYIEPLGKSSSIILEYSFAWQQGQSSREVFVTEEQVSYADSFQSRGFLHYNKEQKAGLFYQYRNKKLETKAGMELQYLSRSSQKNRDDSNGINQNGFNYFPSLNMRYNFSGRKTIDFTYRANVNLPSLTQLQPIPDFTDSLNIFTGNPGLLPEIRNNFQLRYNHIGAKSKNVSWAKLSYLIISHQIIGQTTITASRHTTTPVNANGAYIATAAGGYTFQLIPKILKASAALNFDIAKRISFVNNEMLQLVNYSVAPNFRLQTNSLKWFGGSLKYSYSYSSVTGGVILSDRMLQTHYFAHEGSITLPFAFRLQYYLNYQCNTGFSEGFKQNYWFISAAIDKQFQKLKGLEFHIQAFDIFNQHPTVQRTVGDNYIEDRSVNIFGSCYMFSIMYRFRYFPHSA